MNKLFFFFLKKKFNIQILTEEYKETALLKGLRQSVFKLWMRKFYCDDIYSLAATTTRWYTRTHFRDTNKAKSRIHAKLKLGEEERKEEEKKERKTEITHKERQKVQTNKKNKKEMEFCLIKIQQEKEVRTATENNSTEQYQNIYTLSG